MAITGGYSINHNPAFAGMVADDQVSNIVSKVNNDVATVPYGYGVVADPTDPGGFKAATSTNVAADFVGVLVRELNRSYMVNDTFGAPIDQTASVLTTGVIWVTVSTAVNARDAAYFNVGATTPGQFANAAGSAGTLAVAIPGAKFISAAAAGGLAKLSLVIGG